MVTFLLPFVKLKGSDGRPSEEHRGTLKKTAKTVKGNSLEKCKRIFDVVPSKTTIWNHSETYKSWTKTASTFNLQLYTSGNRKQNP